LNYSINDKKDKSYCHASGGARQRRTSMSTKEYDCDKYNAEGMAFLRQYFYDKDSMPLPINSYKELVKKGEYLQRINQKYGKTIY
jgi:hypothetical protein